MNVGVDLEDIEANRLDERRERESAHEDIHTFTRVQ